VKLNANRIVTGILRGYDQFMNITLDDCREVNQEVEGPTLGMVVIRGSSVMLIEALERL
jgi:small nuclear ribonucleoprotein G